MAIIDARTGPIRGLTGRDTGTPGAPRQACYGFQFVNGSDGSTGIGAVILIRAMLIVCPCCTTSYTLRPNSLRPYGQARCLRCLAIWSPQRHRADMLVAAAAAIGDDFAPLPDPKSGEAGASPPGDLPHVEASSFEPDPLIFDEPDVVNFDPACPGADGNADANPAPEDRADNHEVYFVDLDPDDLPVVPENAAADQGGEGAVVDPGPETVILPELAALDLPAANEASVSDHLAKPSVSLASVPLVPSAEQLHASANETPALDKDVSAPSDSKWVSDNLAPEGMGEETLPNHAANAVQEEPVATDQKGSGLVLRRDAEDGSGTTEAPEHGSALIKEPRPDARRWIVLKVNNSGTKSPEAVTDVALRSALRPRHNLPVPSRGWHPPAKRRFAPRWPLTRLQAGIVALALVDFLLVGWRTDIVRKLPQTASFYELAGLPVNLRGLAFHGITTTTVRDGGKPVLVVEGNIVNNTAKALHVPQLRFAVRDAADQEIYFWTATASRSSLPPGQAVTFRARLASPPAGGRDIVLRFVNRRDVVALNP
jgi:Protein of unknown function (DUF3426)